jgi:hypothetical protein
MCPKRDIGKERVMYIVSVKVATRQLEVPRLQEVFTKFGSSIDTRLGMNTGDEKGLIVLVYSNDDVQNFVEEINAVGDVSASFMEA